MTRRGRFPTVTLAMCGVLLAGWETAGAAGPSITEFSVPTAASNPSGITAGPDGNLWFTEFNANKIGRITPAVVAGIAVYRPTTGEWFIRRVTDRGLTLVAWGAPVLGDRPVPGDYDADGAADVAVYRTTTGEWFVRRSSDSALTLVPWGSPVLGDVPVPGRY
jgi:hypothetical protein